jgi:chorismate synthase
MVKNTSQISKDYSEIANYYRPGHADYTFDTKYGFRDYRGGGRSSGRETIGRVAAGAVALKILKQLGVEVTAYTRSIGPVVIDYENYDASAILETKTAMPDRTADEKAVAYLEETMKACDSAGGVMECVVKNVPVGIGDTVFEKLDANLAKALMSIGAVKAVEIGDGIKVATSSGSTNNDAFCTQNGSVSKVTNHSGGILGGMSDGSDIVLRAYVKPTPSIYATQQTINKNMENIDINIKGRHDPIIVPRAVVVMESMVAITLLDAMMLNMSAKMDSLQQFYK